MIEQLAKKAGDSVWRKVGEKAVITAVTTLLSEAIKASVEIVKKAKLREQKAEFDDRRAREKKAREPDDADESEAAEESSDTIEEADAATSDDAPAAKGPKVDFNSYVAAKR